MAHLLENLDFAGDAVDVFLVLDLVFLKNFHCDLFSLTQRLPSRPSGCACPASPFRTCPFPGTCLKIKAPTQNILTDLLRRSVLFASALFPRLHIYKLFIIIFKTHHSSSLASTGLGWYVGLFSFINACQSSRHSSTLSGKYALAKYVASETLFPLINTSRQPSLSPSRL